MILPDLLSPGLRVVFCGTAASTASARARAYYAGPGNRFWPILHAAGLTPRLLAPAEFGLLTDRGIGLTDVSKTAQGMDREIAADAFDPVRLRLVVGETGPHVIAFNGKKAARLALGLRSTARIEFGPAPAAIGRTPAWVLPSTSRAANRYWDPAPWHALAAALPPASRGRRFRSRPSACGHRPFRACSWRSTRPATSPKIGTHHLLDFELLSWPSAALSDESLSDPEQRAVDDLEKHDTAGL